MRQEINSQSPQAFSIIAESKNESSQVQVPSTTTVLPAQAVGSNCILHTFILNDDVMGLRQALSDPAQLLTRKTLKIINRAGGLVKMKRYTPIGLALRLDRQAMIEYCLEVCQQDQFAQLMPEILGEILLYAACYENWKIVLTVLNLHVQAGKAIDFNRYCDMKLQGDDEGKKIWGVSAFGFLILHNQIEIITTFAHCFDVNQQRVASTQDASPLVIAAQAVNVVAQTLRGLVCCYHSKIDISLKVGGYTALDYALCNNQLDKVLCLLQEGAVLDKAVLQKYCQNCFDDCELGMSHSGVLASVLFLNHCDLFEHCWDQLTVDKGWVAQDIEALRQWILALAAHQPKITYQTFEWLIHKLAPDPASVVMVDNSLVQTIDNNPIYSNTTFFLLAAKHYQITKAMLLIKHKVPVMPASSEYAQDYLSLCKAVHNALAKLHDFFRLGQWLKAGINLIVLDQAELAGIHIMPRLYLDYLVECGMSPRQIGAQLDKYLNLSGYLLNDDMPATDSLTVEQYTDLAWSCWLAGCGVDPISATPRKRQVAIGPVNHHHQDKNLGQDFEMVAKFCPFNRDKRIGALTSDERLGFYKWLHALWFQIGALARQPLPQRLLDDIHQLKQTYYSQQPDMAELLCQSPILHTLFSSPARSVFSPSTPRRQGIFTPCTPAIVENPSEQGESGAEDSLAEVKTRLGFSPQKV